MRVKVSYTIDIKDVPEKVSEVISAAEDVLQDALDTLAEARCAGRNEEQITLVQIDSVRQKLKAADETIADAYGILEGYVQLLQAEPAPQSQAYAQPNYDALNETVSKLDALQQQLAAGTGEAPDENL